MKNRKIRLLLPCALVAFGATMLPAASISLDDAGTDPDLTSPFFSFTMDQNGGFTGQFTNKSDVNFDFLQLTAVFSPDFWNSPAGPPATGVFCNGDNLFPKCTIAIDNAAFTLVYLFTGSPGIPVGRIFGVTATDFQPNQVILAAGAPQVPEPGAFALAGIGFGLLLLGVSREKFLKLRVRS